jgi:hypothetical protein
MLSRIGTLLSVIFVATIGTGTARAGNPRRDLRGEDTIDLVSRYATVMLVSDRVLYDPGEDIPIRFRVTNSGYRTLRIYPFSDDTTFQFLLTDQAGREVEPDANSSRKRYRERGRDNIDLDGSRVKEIILHPNDSFERLIYLNDLYRLEAGKEYSVSGYFFPDARHETFMKSANFIKLRMAKRKDELYYEGVVAKIPPVPATALTPEETIFLFLSSELNKKWDNYLKYIETEKFIASYGSYATRYAIASSAERPSVALDFKNFLISRRDEILRRFEITKTDYDRDAGGQLIDSGRSYVTVVADRETRGYTVRYEYQYALEISSENEGFWKIVSVRARLLQ